jgi:hypothetical protein
MAGSKDKQMTPRFQAQGGQKNASSPDFHKENEKGNQLAGERYQGHSRFEALLRIQDFKGAVGNMARNVGEDSPKEPCTGRLTPKLR